MIFLYTPADGNQTEGIGAVAQCQIHAYVLSRMMQVEFVGRPFTGLQHYQEYSTQEEYCDAVTDFFNFQFNKVDLSNAKIAKAERIDNSLVEFINQHRMTADEIYVELPTAQLQSFADANFDAYKDAGYHSTLAKRIRFDESKYYFDDDKLNIGIHITNFIEGRDNDLSAQREQYVPGNSKEQYYINLINKLNELLSKNSDIEKEFHIYSRGEEKDFEVFTNLDVPVKLHLWEHPLTSIYHLTKSDIRVLSNSSFSYMSALFGAENGMSIIRDNFAMKIDNCVITDYHSNFDESQICFE
jgi:hypothetical protein